MIKEIFKKCGYFINKRKIILSVMTLAIVSLSITGTVSFSSNGEINNDLSKSVQEIGLLNSNYISLKVQESINETIDGYLREYSTYYNLDGDKVVEFARQITNDYSISFNDVSGKITSDSTEGQCMLFVYYLSKDRLSKSLKEYDLSVSYFKTSNNKTTMSRDQVLSSGLTFSQFLGKVCDNLGVDKNYLLAISYLETGKNTSGLALKSNNFGGLRGSGEYFSYPSPEVGIIAFVLNLKGYEKYELNSIYELSGIYTHGNKYNPSNTWVSSVLRYYNDIVSNPSKYFLVEDI